MKKGSPARPIGYTMVVSLAWWERTLLRRQMEYVRPTQKNQIQAQGVWHIKRPSTQVSWLLF
jgi:hypothetical protein